jgi:hypothetical protein
MIVSTVSPASRPDWQAARPSRPPIRDGRPGARPDVAASMRQALIRNELLLTIAATTRPGIVGGC